MWVTISIYLTVVGWSYSIVTLIALLQDKGFQNTLTVNRFNRRVRQLKEPFYLICGCGETGNLICRTLDRTGHAFVVIEKNELRVQELDLQDFKTDTPALAADASNPDNLLLAGLTHPKCRAVLAVTNDEEANLAVAIAVRLLNPSLAVIARGRTPSVTANMASFGTDHIINPFARFAEHLALAVAAPERFRLIELLTALPETPLPEPHRPPRGHWILCGYGRFGHFLADHLQARRDRADHHRPGVQPRANGQFAQRPWHRSADPAPGRHRALHRHHRRQRQRREQPVHRGDRSRAEAIAVRRRAPEPQCQWPVVRCLWRRLHDGAESHRGPGMHRHPYHPAACRLPGLAARTRRGLEQRAGRPPAGDSVQG